MDPFVGQISIFAGNFAPRGYAFCNGQLLPISQNTALFSIFGTNYGGDGKTTFALPNLQGRAPMHQGQGPGLQFRSLGEKGGTEAETIDTDKMAGHRHTLMGSNEVGEDRPAVGNAFARATGGNLYQSNVSANLVAMNPAAAPPAGTGGPHNNMQPYLTVAFICALQGVFPPRS